MKINHEDRDRNHQNQHITDYNRKKSNESITSVDKREYRGNIIRRSNFIQTMYHSSCNNDNAKILQRRNEDKRYHSRCNNDNVEIL